MAAGTALPGRGPDGGHSPAEQPQGVAQCAAAARGQRAARSQHGPCSSLPAWHDSCSNLLAWHDTKERAPSFPPSLHPQVDHPGCDPVCHHGPGPVERRRRRRPGHRVTLSGEAPRPHPGSPCACATLPAGCRGVRSRRCRQRLRPSLPGGIKFEGQAACSPRRLGELHSLTFAAPRRGELELSVAMLRGVWLGAPHVTACSRSMLGASRAGGRRCWLST